MPIGCAFRAMLGAALAKLRYLYNEGIENVAWVDGYMYYDPAFLGLASRSKEADHLYFYARAGNQPGPTSEVAYVTDATINLTAYTKLTVDWANDGNTGSGNFAILNVSTEKDAGFTTYTSQIYKDSDFSRQTDELDVSALNGNYYVRPHAVSAAHEEISIVRVYKIWLE